MPDEVPPPTLDRERTTNIVAAYVRHNQIGADQVSVLISTVHQALVGLGKPAAETEIERTPAVSIRQSVHRDYVVRLDCGWRGQMLKRHLATGHGLTVEQYRVRWTLPREHPITAPSFRSADLVWRNRSALGVDGGAGLPAKNQSRSHQKSRQHRSRDLGGDEGCDPRWQRSRRDWDEIGSARQDRRGARR